MGAAGTARIGFRSTGGCVTRAVADRAGTACTITFVRAGKRDRTAGTTDEQAGSDQTGCRRDSPP
ncbi:hypothetical protein AWB94_02815 [Mycolicibacterium canariasense]|nr:hypothetical protein AWB94_02815 [Mycolicibacterium canariasense]